MRTKAQEYASRIFPQVSGMSDAGQQARAKYGSMAHKLPVRTAGLAQALGFVESRGTPEQKKLIQHISEAIGVPDMCERSRKAELHEYMALTSNAMAALVWYKRFATSVLGVQSDVDVEDVGE